MISFAPQITERTEGKSKVLGHVHRGRVDLRMKLTQRKAEPRAGKRKSQAEEWMRQGRERLKEEIISEEGMS